MEKISNIEELNIAIAALEIKRSDEGRKVKEQFVLVQDGLRPANLLKTAFKDLITSPELKDGILDVTMGVTAGFLTKKAVSGDSQNIFQKLIASAAESFVSTEVTKNGEQLRSWVSTFFKKQ